MSNIVGKSISQHLAGVISKRSIIIIVTNLFKGNFSKPYNIAEIDRLRDITHN